MSSNDEYSDEENEQGDEGKSSTGEEDAVDEIANDVEKTPTWEDLVCTLYIIFIIYK